MTASQPTQRLDQYGAGTARALLLGDARTEEWGLVQSAGRHALLEAARTLDRAAMVRFGEAFFAAYDEVKRPAPAESTPALSSTDPTSVPAGPRLTMEQYAKLRAECVESPPEKADEIRARYGLDEASDALEAAAWARVFADRSLFEQYREQFLVFRRAVAPAPPPPPPPAPSAPILLPNVGPGGTRLSIQQYASLRADCLCAPPEQLEEVRARYGLDEASDVAEVAAWGDKFAEDPDLFERYKVSFQYFRGLAAQR